MCQGWGILSPTQRLCQEPRKLQYFVPPLSPLSLPSRGVPLALNLAPALKVAAPPQESEGACCAEAFLVLGVRRRR